MLLAALALLELSARAGYPLLFGLVAVESAGIPVPGETALVAAGIFAADGRLQIEWVIVVAAVAAILGDNAGYVVGRTGGRRLLERPGLLERHRREVLERGEPFFAKHGPKAVFLGRWVAVLRIAAAWLAGINRMHWRTFVFWNALGGIAWAASVALLAYAVGDTAEKVIRGAGAAGGAAAVLAGGAAWLWHRHRRREERAAG